MIRFACQTLSLQTPFAVFDIRSRRRRLRLGTTRLLSLDASNRAKRVHNSTAVSIQAFIMFNDSVINELPITVRLAYLLLSTYAYDLHAVLKSQRTTTCIFIQMPLRGKAHSTSAHFSHKRRFAVVRSRCIATGQRRKTSQRGRGSIEEPTRPECMKKNVG